MSEFVNDDDAASCCVSMYVHSYLPTPLPRPLLACVFIVCGGGGVCMYSPINQPTTDLWCAGQTAQNIRATTARAAVYPTVTVSWFRTTSVRIWPVHCTTTHAYFVVERW